MKNLIHPPEDSFNVAFWTNGTGADVASGQPVVFAGGIMVAQGAVVSAAVGSLLGTFVHEYTKVSAQAWTLGQAIYYDATAKKYTTVALGNVHAGEAFLAAANPSALGQVRLRKPTGLRMVAGQQTTVAAADTVVTGLTTVLSAVASLESDPVDDPMLVTAFIGDQAGTPAAGSIIIKTWKNTAGTDPTPAAATTFTKKVNWIAWGY